MDSFMSKFMKVGMRGVKAAPMGLWCLDSWEDEWVIAGGVGGVLGVWELGEGKL